MVAAIPNGTDVWMTVPASPPLRLTIRPSGYPMRGMPTARISLRVWGRADFVSVRRSPSTAAQAGGL